MKSTLKEQKSKLKDQTSNQKELISTLLELTSNGNDQTSILKELTSNQKGQISSQKDWKSNQKHQTSNEKDQKSILLALKNAGNYDGILHQIDLDRPVILTINADATWYGALDHYVVIEGVYKQNWHNTGVTTQIAYYCNYGHQTTIKWLFYLGGANVHMWDAFIVVVN